jgi:hypothetical protein
MIKSVKEVAIGNEFAVKFTTPITSAQHQFVAPKGKKIQNHFLEIQTG